MSRETDESLANDLLVKRVLEKEIEQRNGTGKILHLDQRLNLCLSGGLIVVHYEEGTGYFRRQANGPVVAYVKNRKLRDGSEGKIQAELKLDGKCHVPGNPTITINLIDYLIMGTISYHQQ